MVEVCFADGAAPKCASFLLLAHPGLGRSQVKVFREPRPVASCQEAEKVAQTEALQCQEEVRQLRAERGVPEGLRGTLASGLMGLEGIAAKNLTRQFTEPKGNALVPQEATATAPRARSQWKCGSRILARRPGRQRARCCVDPRASY